MTKSAAHRGERGGLKEAGLSARGLSKRYGVVTVLRGVDLELRTGEVHALVGANGAGKSTLCKILAGLVPATSGTMQLAGSDYTPADKREAERYGVQMVHQELNLIPTLSVAENLLLRTMPTRLGFAIRRAELLRRARQILLDHGLGDLDPEASAGSLGVGHQQMLEIAGVLAREGRVLLLDEPTAALGPSESQRLFEWIGELRARGVAIVYVSHRLAEVIRLADRVTVLRDGECVESGPAAGLTAQDLVTAMSGSAPAVAKRANEFRSHVKEEMGLRVEGLRSSALRDVSFAVRRGERFGVAGLVGSGRSELLRAIFGADLAEAGSVQVGEQWASRFAVPAEAVSAGMALVTEDRKADGLLLPQSVRTNGTLRALDTGLSTAGVVRAQEERWASERQCDAIAVHCASQEQPVEQLSGGNQQKLAVAKWLLDEAPAVEVLLFDEPTRGIDVSARAKLHEVFAELAKQGKTLVIVSSDDEELFDSCDRIGVMSNGHLVRVFERGEWSEEALLAAAFSGYAGSEGAAAGALGTMATGAEDATGAKNA